jgi:hypothetical protein
MMAKKKIVPRNEMTMTRPSYFKCIKNINTRLPFMEAITKATQTFNHPKSTMEAATVTLVNIKRAVSTRPKNL